MSDSPDMTPVTTKAQPTTRMFGIEVRRSRLVPADAMLLIHTVANDRGEPEPRLTLVLIEPQKPLTLAELADLGWFGEEA